jgi:hypothetical protein
MVEEWYRFGDKVETLGELIVLFRYKVLLELSLEPVDALTAESSTNFGSSISL